MTYQKMKEIFQLYEIENSKKKPGPRDHLLAHIIFAQDSFDKTYSEIARTYAVSSDNKAFLPNMSGYSIFASCLDGTDPCVRLEKYIDQEFGGETGWHVENCIII